MDSRRRLPSVDQVLRNLELRLRGVPQSLITAEIRAILAERRQAFIAKNEITVLPIEQIVEERIKALLEPSLRPVINASGVILHTNLGRAPLASFKPISRYSNLEYDLKSGRRGKRDAHTAGLLERLIGKPAIIVNNNAAAVYLVLNELAAGYEVIVSRGELIEIGDGFRIPEIMGRSGALLREIGTTNRTRIDDYKQAINERTRLILRVHPSNFRVTGFTARPKLRELADLGRVHGISVYEDLGSGCVIDLREHGINEPLVSDSLASGINLVSFSCDKLLGGPQSGIIAGDAELVNRIRKNPMYRAFRVDKLIVETLEKTLRHLLMREWEAIPTLQMIFESSEKIRQRAERVAQELQSLKAKSRQSESAIGGGSTPDQTLPTWVVELQVPNATSFEEHLRSAPPKPVIGRIEKERIILDMRTVAMDEEEELISAVRNASQS